MKKIITAIMMVLVFVMMTACSSGSQPASGGSTETAAPAAESVKSETQAPAQTAAQAAPDTAAPDTAAPDNASEEDDSDADIIDINFYSFNFVPPTDVQHVEDAINEITEAKIHVHVNYTVMDFASYTQQIGMMIAGGDQIDLMLSGFGPTSFSSMMAQHQLMEISDYLDEYGQDILAACGSLIDGVRSGDGIYAMPGQHNVRSGVELFMRQDVLEDLGLLEQAQNVSSVADLEEILKAVQESDKWNYLRPIYPGMMLSGITVGETFADSDVYETLGNQNQLIHVKDGKVSLVMETETYQQIAAVLRDLKAKDYIKEDVGTGDSMDPESQMRNDLLFSFIIDSDYGAEESVSLRCGYPLVPIMIAERTVNSEAISKFCFEVPSTAKEPEAAVTFMNLCYTSPELNNLLTWGVEGVDYVVKDGVATYPEGKDGADYHQEDFMAPNTFLLTPWEGNPVDYYENIQKGVAEAVVSDYNGFSLDMDEISLEIASITNIINEYDTRVKIGVASAEELQEYIDKLYDAGAEKVVAYYQEQLDAWLGK